MTHELKFGEHLIARPKARLDLDGDVVHPGAELSYTVVNTGEAPLLFGAGYGFERRALARWRPRPTGLAFAAWGRQVSPGTTSAAMSARVPPSFEPGRYRLTTDLTVLHADSSPVRGPSGPINLVVSREFTVEKNTE